MINQKDINEVMRKHIVNLVNYYNCSRAIKYRNQYIDEISDFSFLYDSVKHNFALLSYFKETSLYRDVISYAETFNFIRSKGYYIFKILLGQDLLSDIIQDVSVTEKKPVDFETRYGIK